MKNILPLFFVLYSSVIMAKPSQEERQDRRYQVTLGTLNEYNQPSSGTVSLGYFLTPDQAILLRLTESHHTRWNDSEKGTYSADMEAWTLGYRKFFGNSFNIMPTLYFRHLIEDRIITQPSPDLDTKDGGIGMRLGNEWQTDYFTYGCDWFGINTSLFKSKEYNLYGSYKHRFTTTLLSFYVGVFF